MGDIVIFGERLKQLRSSLNLSQREFAEKVGITASALSTYEKGQKNPSVLVAINIAKEFHVSLDWLCGLKKQSNKFRPDFHVPFDLPAALSGLMYLIHYNLLSLPHTEEKEEYGVISADILEVSDGDLNQFIHDTEQLKDLNANGAISDEILTICLEELIYNVANDIQLTQKRAYERRKKELEEERKKKLDEQSKDGTLPF